MRVAGRHCPGRRAGDPGRGPRRRAPSRWPILAPDPHPVWKSQLRDGTIDPRVAAAVGDVLGRIHARDRRSARHRGALSHRRHLLRDPPRALSRRDRDARIRTSRRASRRSSRRRAPTKRVLVHGDFSPKNLLIGPHGPVILDAECAWYGDPAFDLAFVLNHLLLKGAWRPQWRARYAAAFDALVDAYLAHVHWEPRHALAARTAALLPALMLARDRRQITGRVPDATMTVKDRGSRVCARALLRGPARRDPRAIAAALGCVGDEARPICPPCTRAAASGIRAGARRVEAEVTLAERRREDARSRRPGRRAARARRSTCAMAASAHGGFDVARAVANVDGADRRARSTGLDAARPGAPSTRR